MNGALCVTKLKVESGKGNANAMNNMATPCSVKTIGE